MSVPLLRNGVPVHRNGVPILIPEGSDPADCDCCDDVLGNCPEKKICLVEGAYVYPTRRNLTMTVTGVDGTWSGFWQSVYCNGPAGLPPCCSKLQLNRKISWAINGFGAFNGTFGYIPAPPTSEFGCQNVCFGCVMVLPYIYVRVTGVVNEEFTRTYQHNGNCGPDDLGSYSWNRSSDVCGIASLRIDPLGMTAHIRLECLNYNGTLMYGGTGDLPEPYDLRIWALKPSDCAIIDPENLGTNDQCLDITKPWWHYSGYDNCLSQEESLFRVLEGGLPGIIGDEGYASASSHTCPDVGTFSDDYTGEPWGPCDEYEFFNGESPGCILAGASDCAASNPGGAGNSWSYKHFKTDPFSSSWTVNIQNT